MTSEERKLSKFKARATRAIFGGDFLFVAYVIYKTKNIDFFEQSFFRLYTK